jgi:Zn-finger protein
MKDNYRFFQNVQCEYFPCHPIKPAQLDDFSCLFCFCPLYRDKNCGGNWTLTSKGIKDCTNCTLPHFNYDAIIAKLKSFND